MKSKKNLQILIIVFLSILVGTQDIYARHIIGGEITYVITGEGDIPNTRNYRFTMKIYRDCSSNGAEFDNPAELGFYRGSGDDYSYLFTRLIDYAGIVRLLPEDSNPCLIVPPNICVEEAVYQWDEMNLTVIDENYLVAYRRCCRNNSISNIIDPGASGATYFIEITPKAQEEFNNSPTFNSFPPIVICVNQEIDFSHAATDVDGDQLVYSFCPPKLGGGNGGSFENPLVSVRDCAGITPDPANCPPPFEDVQFILPTYSFDKPMGGDPVVNINSNSGLIDGVPNIQGQFVVGVCVDEYRDGVLIGRIQRDFQFNVTICEPAVFASITADSVFNTRNFVINSCGIDLIEFTNESDNVAFIDEYSWKFFIGNDVVTDSNRNTTVQFPGVGTYLGEMRINPGLACEDSAFIEVNIFPSIYSEFDFDYDTCIAGPVDFTDLSESGSGYITDWLWNLEGDFVSEQNPEYLFSSPGLKNIVLTVTDTNGCVADTSAQITWQPAPPLVVLSPDRFTGCTPKGIFFENLSSPIDSTYIIDWDFGDGNFSNDISPTHFYEEAGVYSVTVDITSPIGCTVSGFFEDYITMLAGPIANFSYNPLEPSSFNPVVDFTDESIDAVSWQWFFGDESASFQQNPSYSFRDSGLYDIILIVSHESGCTDSAFARIDVVPKVTYFIPNAFTPNNDGLNDAFLGKGATSGMSDFRLTVWNRWGERIFESTDPMEGWNGRKNNVGIDSPQGVYSVFVEYKDPRGKDVVIEGIATLLR